MDDHKQAIQAQFGATAAAYVTSTGHAAGQDLQQLVALASEVARREYALDVATGGGHTARAVAPLFGLVVASDLTGPMLRAARGAFEAWGLTNTLPVQADAEALPFHTDCFDLVTCRIAPHHFGDPARFVHEVGRVLRPGGRFVLIDSSVPEETEPAAWLNRLETLRDATHGRTLPVGEWLGLVAESGLALGGHALYTKRHDLADWLARAKTPADRRAAVLDAITAADPAIRSAFGLEYDDAGIPVAFTDAKVLLWADKVLH